MQPLPKWVLTNPRPGVYDTESGTAADMTAKVYNAMAELIEEYNAFADAANIAMESFTTSETEARAAFEQKIISLYREFQCQMDTYLRLNLDDTATKVINEGMSAGSILIPTDSGLIKENYPADAKATGEAIAASSAALAAEIATERARISNLTANSGASTAENAELVDIRIGSDGTSYSTAGDAVRNQVKQIANKTADKQSKIVSAGMICAGAAWENKSAKVDSAAAAGYTTTDNATRALSGVVPISVYQGGRFVLEMDPSLMVFFNWLDENQKLISQSNYAYNGDTVDIPRTAYYVRFQACLVANGNIPLSMLLHDIRLVRPAAETAEDLLYSSAYESYLEKSRREYNKLPQDPRAYINGSIATTGRVVYSDTRICTLLLPMDYTAVKVKHRAAGHKISIATYDKNMTATRVTDWLAGETEMWPTPDTAFIAFTIANLDDSAITPDDIANVKICVSDVSGENAVDIKVMGYNVGGYAWGERDKKVMNTATATAQAVKHKEFFNRHMCDIVSIEEQYQYMDAESNVPSGQLYNALYPFNYFPTHGHSAFYSKVKLNNTQEHTTQGSGRPFISADVKYKGKEIHLVCVHFHPSDATIRAAEFAEIVEYLSDKGRFIMFGDFNVTDVSEYEALTEAGYKIANGGYMDYMNTYNPTSDKYYPGYYDNVATSSDIVLKNIQIPDVYNELASDHLPVICEFTIL